MKLQLQNPRFTIVKILFIASLFSGCTKSTEGIDIQLAKEFLSNKIWYLDYTVTGANTKTYVGQSTYFISFLKDYSSKDSDGYTGTYSIEKWNGSLEIHIQSKKSNGSSIEYKYSIESAGENNLILSYLLAGQTQKTKMYFSSARQ